MSASLGFDLNGLWDFVAEGDGESDTLLKNLGVRGSIVRLQAEQNRWVGGAQVALAPHGKGLGWGQIGAAENRIFLNDVLDRLAEDDAEATQAAAFGGFLEEQTKHADGAVFAVPDISNFDEAARDRLLRLLRHASRLRSTTLLWRPIAAILGWIKASAHARTFQPSEGLRIAVLSLMGSGIQVADAKLIRESWSDSEIWVPERDRAGVAVSGACAGENLAHRVAREFADSLRVPEREALLGINAPWRISVGERPEFELLRMPNRSWRKLPDIAGGDIALALEGLPRTVGELLDEADALLVEGPMAGHVAWVDAILRAAGWRAGRPVHRAEKGLVAKGCLEAALRAHAGAPVYYDFLPQLEIYARVADELRFVELIPKNTRLLGGKAYKGDAPGDFVIDKGATRLTFYLFKEDFSKGRKAEDDLPEKTTSQHRIRVSVEQVPGQGFARVRIESDTFEALRRKPLELDWSRMEIVEQSREEILAAPVERSGLAYPDTVSIKGHPLHWHSGHRAGNLLDQLQTYVDLPLLRGNAVEGTAHAALKVLRERFRRPENPAFVARKMGVLCNDQGSFRALDSDGKLPSSSGDLAVPYEAERLLDTALAKVGQEFDRLIARKSAPAVSTLVGDIAGFATWCFWRCPPSITDFLLEFYEGSRIFPIHHILRREGVGRIVHQPEHLDRYFAVVDAKLGADGLLAAAEFSALGRVLGGCPDATERLRKVTVDRIVQQTISELSKQNDLPRGDAYKRKFKAALLMLAPLLRYRRTLPSFLDPEESNAAQTLLEILKEAETKNRRFMEEEERSAKRTVGARRVSHLAAAKRFGINSEILRELIRFIYGKGSDPNIIRRIDDMAIEEFEDPTSEFIRDRLEVGPMFKVERGALFTAWVVWCTLHGLEFGTPETFDRDLHNTLPSVKVSIEHDGDDRTRFYAGVGLRPPRRGAGAR